eukprot:9491698-Pyramimonas_sp.AAC.1
MQSGSAGWTRLGEYCFSGGPWKANRLPFVSNVAGRLRSGLESYALSPRELHRLDSSLARKFRALMTGAAHHLDEQDALHSLTTHQ